MLSILFPRKCRASDVTLVHLEHKLARLERCTQKPNAKDSDYIARDRVAVQLAEARTISVRVCAAP